MTIGDLTDGRIDIPEQLLDLGALLFGGGRQEEQEQGEDDVQRRRQNGRILADALSAFGQALLGGGR